jgi:hypothetical protein
MLLVLMRRHDHGNMNITHGPYPLSQVFAASHSDCLPALRQLEYARDMHMKDEATGIIRGLDADQNQHASRGLGGHARDMTVHIYASWWIRVLTMLLYMAHVTQMHETSTCHDRLWVVVVQRVCDRT